MTNNESELIIMAQNGDKEAFGELMNKNIDKIYRLSFGLTGNEADSNDLTQEVFIKAFKSIKSFESKSSFSTWLYRICNNTWINERKRLFRRRVVPLDKPLSGKDSDFTVEVKDHRKNSEQKLEETEMKKIVHNAISSLKPVFRMVIILKFIENRSYDEIAEICNCSIKTVGSRVTRGTREMKRILHDYVKGGRVEL